MRKLDDQFLLDEINRFIDENDRIPTYDDMCRKNGYPSQTSYARAFGTWVNALKLAQVECVHSDEYLLDELRRCGAELGRTPMCEDMKRKNGYPSRGVYSKRFGSFNNALVRAGFKLRIINREFLLEEIYRCAAEKDKIPSQYDMGSENGYPSPSTYCKFFGTWSNALLEAGFKPYHDTAYTREVLISELIRFKNDNNRVPTARDMITGGDYPPLSAYVREFGTWNSCLRYMGFELHRSDNIVYDENLYCAECGEFIDSEAYWNQDDIVCKKCYSVEYRKKHPEEISERRHVRRGFGYNPINEQFEGSNGHHVFVEQRSDYIIYLPEFLHLLYPHNHADDESMVCPNAIAFDYWMHEDFYTQLYLEGAS